MIDHLHFQRLAYNEVEWCTTKLKLLFETVCKNSIFVLGGGGNVEYDIDYYRSLIDGGYVKDNDLWIFWMKTESHSPNEISDLKDLISLKKLLATAPTATLAVVSLALALSKTGLISVKLNF